ncbi:hypothetical protein FACS1894152_5460 [Bacilli bacterium]|nr:hypothetical protein FACS1894152_5460 [Bacilli bacterium]
MLWIALDGVDAVGKTTQARILYNRFSKKYRTALLGEFSNSPVGDLIVEIIRKKRFFSIDDDKKSPVADSFLLISDMLYKAEKEVQNDTELIISDRGLLSLLVYQALRIEKNSRFFVDGNYDSFRFLEEILDKTFLPIIKPTFHIVYTLKPENINKYSVNRGEPPLLKDELNFLENIQMKIVGKISQTNGYVLPIDSLSIEEVSFLTESIVENEIRKNLSKTI